MSVIDLEGSASAKKRKAFANITHGRRLLVFRHPDAPGAGVQVPGGTIPPGDAVLREAREVTGLKNLRLVTFLGETIRAVDECSVDFPPGELHQRLFVHLRCESEPPETWRYLERFAEGHEAPIAFDCFWADLPDGVPALIADQGAFIPHLLASLDERQGNLMAPKRD